MTAAIISAAVAPVLWAAVRLALNVIHDRRMK